MAGFGPRLRSAADLLEGLGSDKMGDELCNGAAEPFSVG